MKHLAILAAGIVAVATPALAQHSTVVRRHETVTTVSRVHGPVKLLPHHNVRHCQTKWVAHRRVRKCYYR